MIAFLRTTFVLLAYSITLPATAAVPSRIIATYDVYKDSIKGATVEETFTRDKNSYRIESVSKAAGILFLLKPETITVVSQGKLTAQGLQPQSFTQQRKLDTERNTSADFDWDNSRITLRDRNGERTTTLPPDTQDRLSAMYQPMFVALQKAATFDFHMTNGSKVDIYNYLLTPGQSVTVPLGTLKANYLSNSPKAGESHNEMWLATEHSNFPCKMVITDPDGSKLIQVLTSLNTTP